MKDGRSCSLAVSKDFHLISSGMIGPAKARAPDSDSVIFPVVMLTVKVVGVALTSGNDPLRADVVQPEVITVTPAPPFGRDSKLLTALKTATFPVTVTLVMTPAA